MGNGKEKPKTPDEEPESHEDEELIPQFLDKLVPNEWKPGVKDAYNWAHKYYREGGLIYEDTLDLLQNLGIDIFYGSADLVIEGIYEADDIFAKDYPVKISFKNQELEKQLLSNPPAYFKYYLDYYMGMKKRVELRQELIKKELNTMKENKETLEEKVDDRNEAIEANPTGNYFHIEPNPDVDNLYLKDSPPKIPLFDYIQGLEEHLMYLEMLLDGNTEKGYVGIDVNIKRANYWLGEAQNDDIDWKLDVSHVKLEEETE